MSNFYEILGISEDATEKDIKKAYRTLSLKYHPDRNPENPESQLKFQQINEANETLSDPAARQQYDMQRKGGGGMQFASNMGGDFDDINNIFSMMFGGMGGMNMGGMNMGGGRHMGGPGIHIFNSNGGGFGGHSHIFQQLQKPPPIVKNIQITMEQSFHGANIPVQIERNIVINGVNSVEVETIYLTIPPGIDENEIVILRDKGNILNEHIKGDLKICIQTINNTPFRRQGLDLIYCKTVSLKEALCGFSFELKHLNGTKMCLNNTTNNTIIRPNFKKVIPELGMIREQSKGNLIIDFTIEFPEQLTPEQIEKLVEIL